MERMAELKGEPISQITSGPICNFVELTYSAAMSGLPPSNRWDTRFGMDRFGNPRWLVCQREKKKKRKNQKARCAPASYSTCMAPPSLGPSGHQEKNSPWTKIVWLPAGWPRGNPPAFRDVEQAGRRRGVYDKRVVVRRPKL